MERNRWKLIAGGAALVGIAAGGIAGTAGDGVDLNDRRAGIALVQPASVSSPSTTAPAPATSSTTTSAWPAPAAAPGASPHDSPGHHSPDSAVSPDDPGRAGPPAPAGHHTPGHHTPDAPGDD